MQRTSLRLKARKQTKRIVAIIKPKRRLALSLAVLIVSTPFLIIQIIRIANAINVWNAMKNAPEGDYLLPAVIGKTPKTAEDALKAVDDEERGFIVPFLLVAASTIGVLHSADLKITPRRCYYCGKWVGAAKAKQAPDKSFHYHPECEPKQPKPT